MHSGLRIFSGICVGIGILALAAAALSEGIETSSMAETATDAACAVVLRSISGEYIFLSDICYPGAEKPRKPRSVVVLNFMASDCAPCRQEIPQFLVVAREYKNRGVRAFLVATDPLSETARLRTLVGDLKADCEVLLDPYKVACRKLGVKGVPATFVLLRTGQIAAEVAGGENFERSLREALQNALR